MQANRVEIDLLQFKKNITLVKASVNGSLLCLPVKSNAYGHGLVKMAKAAEESAAVDYLAVADLSEAIELRQSGISLPILVLGALFEEQVPLLISNHVEFTIASPYKARMVLSHCEKMKMSCRVHLEVDTGMRRTGMRPSTAIDLFNELKGQRWLKIVGVYSHLANGGPSTDPIAQKQIEDFAVCMKQLSSRNRPLLFHLANSYGIQHLPDAMLQMVRPGLVCYGYPSEGQSSLSAVQPCFSLISRVCYFKVVEKGQGISYGHAHITSDKTRIVTLPLGYGDGYRRSLSNQSHVLIRSKRYPIVGNICMNQMMVDVGNDSVYVGDEAVLIGKQADQQISVAELARLCGTIPYEILCQFGSNLPRFYL